jgi:hypothetical protein
MSNRIILSLQTLPVEIIYRILDHQCDLTIICSMRNVSQRLNNILDSYHRYQVNYFFILNVLFSSTSETITSQQQLLNLTPSNYQ